MAVSQFTTQVGIEKKTPILYDQEQTVAKISLI